MRSPDSGLHFVAVLASAIAVIVSSTRYVVSRFSAERKQGKSVSDAFADGVKPLTGSVWSDALLFLAVIVGGVAVISYYIR